MSEAENAKTYFLYILECNNGSLYTGITNNLENRLKMHEGGKGSKYVRAHLPFKLVYQEECADKSTALRREIKIKNLTRIQKLKLLNTSNEL